MRIFLRICAFYNIGWAIFIFFFTSTFIKWITASEFQEIYHVELHAIGLFILGLIFILTSFYPIRFWYLIAFGFLAKTFGGIWVYYSILQQTINSHFIIHLVINDLLWAAILALVTLEAFSLYKLVD